jgi:hypothetical protein
MGVLHRMGGQGGSSESTGVLPITKLPAKLVVLWAFDRGEDGELVPAWDAREMPDERRAIATAQQIAHLHAGVIAWSREANPAAGEFGPSEVLYRHGSIPDLD